MPANKTKVTEYECIGCGYKWINRHSAKEGPIPKNCAKCKRMSWTVRFRELHTIPKRL